MSRAETQSLRDVSRASSGCFSFLHICLDLRWRLEADPRYSVSGSRRYILFPPQVGSAELPALAEKLVVVLSSVLEPFRRRGAAACELPLR